MLEPKTRPSGTQFVGELADLAAGTGTLLFVLAPFALPMLALILVVAAALLMALLVGTILLAPVLAARLWWRARDRAITARRRSADAPEPGRVERQGGARAPVTLAPWGSRDGFAT